MRIGQSFCLKSDRGDETFEGYCFGYLCWEFCCCGGINGGGGGGMEKGTMPRQIRWIGACVNGTERVRVRARENCKRSDEGERYRKSKSGRI